jgi:hypothetical protein
MSLSTKSRFFKHARPFLVQNGNVPTKDLQSLIDLPRQGHLLGEDGLAVVGELAASVKCIAGEEYWAPDVVSAAGWLLRLAYENADLASEQHDRLPRLIPRPRLLCFRGQSAKYSLLAPSISRVSPVHRKRNQIAIAWFHVGVQLWADAKFRFLPHDDLWSRDHSYRLDKLGDVQPVAQHYGLGTNLIDWTWDPMVAICFASHRLNTTSPDPSERNGRVCIRTVHPESKEQAMLPPSFATRIWLQRGLFQYQPDPIDLPVIVAQLGDFGRVIASHQKVSSYPSISYVCSDNEQRSAERIIERLLLEKDPLLAIAKWAQSVAESFSEFPGRSLAFLPDFKVMEEELPAELVLAFTRIVDSSDEVHEDPLLMIEYVHFASLRHASAGKRYDAWALYLLAKAMTDRHYLCREPNVESDSTIKTLQQFMSRPDFYRVVVQGGHLGDPPLWP